MEYVILILHIVLYVLSLAGGVWLWKSRNRWVAFVLCLFLSWIGFVLAFLLLKKRCLWCAEYMYPSAKVCPHCGRNWKGGNVTVSIAPSRQSAANAAPTADSRIVYDAKTHQYVKA